MSGAPVTRKAVKLSTGRAAREPVRPGQKMPVLPQVPWERNRIWISGCSHFTRCKRVAYAIVDVVTHYWIGYLLTTEQTSTQA